LRQSGTRGKGAAQGHQPPGLQDARQPLHGFGIFFAGLSDGLAQKIRTGSEIFFDCGHGGLSGDATCKANGFAAASELARQTFDKAAAGVLVPQLGDAGDEVHE